MNDVTCNVEIDRGRGEIGNSGFFVTLCLTLLSIGIDDVVISLRQLRVSDGGKFSNLCGIHVIKDRTEERGNCT
jgi:hypothetical protein